MSSTEGANSLPKGGRKVEVEAALPVDARAAPAEDAITQNSKLEIQNFLTSPYLTLVSRLVLGVVFLVYGLSKLGVVSNMTDSINGYDMNLPAALVQIMAVTLPVIELAVGIWLLVGLFTRLSAAVAATMLVIFIIAMAQATVRGLDIDCGCVAGAQAANPLGVALINAMGPLGGFFAKEKVGLGSIIRDGVFLLMAVHLFFVPTVFSLDGLRHGRVDDAEYEYGDEEVPEEAGEE